MKMIGDYDLFVQLCDKRGIAPPAEILEAIKSGSSTGELRLPCLSIVVPICVVLSRVLSSSTSIRVLDLSDCMLLSEGLSSVLDALCEGSSVTSLSLKGNNISGASVSQLGGIFLRNNTLKRLSLEWNSLGADVEAFSKFCEGLSQNHNIEELDLRYNQISPQSADSLARALGTNKSLKLVDLAWNNLGLRGGQQLLRALDQNHSLTKLNLRGNCIPDELVNSIEEFTQRNKCRSVISREKISQTLEIAKIVNFDEDLQVRSSKLTIDDNLGINEPAEKCLKFVGTKENVTEIDNSTSTTKIVGRSGGDGEKVDKVVEVRRKIAELSEILQERTTAIDLLTREVGARAEEAEAAKSAIGRLEEEIRRMKEERESFEVEKLREAEETKEIGRKKEEQWQRECKMLQASLRESSRREKEMEIRAQRYERELRKSSGELATMREKSIAQTQSYEDVLARSRIEIHRVRREAKERDNRQRIEVNVLKNTLKESTEALEECQAQLQKCRGELREASENSTSLKSRLLELERVNCRLVGIEESFQKVKDEKKTLEEKLLDCRRTIAVLQRQTTTLQGELIEPQRRYALLKDELEQEREKNARLKIEIADQRSRLQELNSQTQTLNSQINALNNQINEIQNNHAETLRERDKERRTLKDIINNKERDFNELKTEEVQRASQLYAAFSKYLGSIGPNTTL